MHDGSVTSYASNVGLVHFDGGVLELKGSNYQPPNLADRNGAKGRTPDNG